MKSLFQLILAGAFTLAIGSLVGCQTMEGLGKDVQSGGKAISRASK